MALATNTTLGSIVLGGDLTGSAGAPSLRVTGVVPGAYALSNLVVDAKGRLVYIAPAPSDQIMDMLPPGSVTTPGPITPCDQLMMVGNALTLNMNDATYSNATIPHFGKVSIGAGLEVEDGEVKLPYATIYSKGIMQAGTGLDVVAGVLSLGEITAGEKGTVQIGDNIDVTDGIISYSSIATTTTPGVVSVGAGLTIVNGVMGWTPPSDPVASKVAKGYVQVGTNITLTGNTISLPIATDTVKGVVQTGPGISATNGVLSIADASYTSKGVVQVGSGLAVNAGVIDVILASKTAKGIAQVGDNIDVTAGVISVKTATTGQLGLTQVGTNIDVTAGEISVKTGSSSQLGLVRIGTNIDVTAGVISIATASDTMTGVAQAGDGFGVAGSYMEINSTVLSKTQNRTTTVAQHKTANVIYGSPFDWDGTDSGNIMTMFLSADAVLNNGTNIIAGTYYHFIIDAGAPRIFTTPLTYGSQFKFKPNSQTQPIGSRSVLSCYAVDSNTLYCIMQPQFV